MTEFQIQIAGQIVAVCAMFDSTQQFCKDYLCDGEAAFTV